MVLIASIGLAVFNWINNGIETLGRVQEHGERQQAIRNVLAFMRTVNPMEKPTGEAPLGAYTIRWSSNLVEPVRDGVGYPAGSSLFRLGLYDMRIGVFIDEKEIAAFNLRQVGYHQERQFQIGL
jgi:hypothetical protein